MSPEPLRECLTGLGLGQVLQARNGAVSALAAQLPPALLADQLGMSLAIATAWSKAVGAARGDYAALRASAQQRTTTTPPTRSDTSDGTG